ncbi:MAG: M20/M25/M40 family metallo-hydrolase [Vicinamibacterales bacterium]
MSPSRVVLAFAYAVSASMVCGSPSVARAQSAQATAATAPPRRPAPSSPAASSRESLDYATLGRIRAEGLQRSQVMDHVSWLADVYGPRLTGSPAFAEASAWAMKKMTEWGLVNVHQERFAFGKGWSLKRFSIHQVAPQIQPLIGFPKAWSPSTKGAVTANVVQVVARSDADFERYRGKLSGTVVLTQSARPVRLLDGRIVLRMTPEDVAEAETTPIPPPEAAPTRTTGPSLQERLERFLQSEGVVATIDRGADTDVSAGGSDLSWETQRVDGGTIFVGTTGTRGADAGAGLPSLTLAVEHYNRLVRVLEKGVPVQVELLIDATFHDETDLNGINTVGEIPGTDLASEVVLLGAHLDSVHSASGATDNATGSAAMLEAARILQALGVRPRRTIRVGLWGGEEQGLVGSRAYAAAHYGDARTLALKPEHAGLAASFNLDNGTGRIRGVWLQGNLAVKPIFEAWIDPLRDLGVSILGPRSVGSTDHVSFDDLGLPAFQFVQERLEYNSRTHHSNMDFVDHVQRDDMVQMATVVAVFAYNAAMRDERLPRKALPPARRP